jgi:hypothetical protein
VSGLRPEEVWAAECIRRALDGVDVQPHDDGSRPGMHDLELWREGHRFGAVEITAAADRESIELWNIVNGSDERWIEPDLTGGWIVGVEPRAKVRRLRSELPGLLADLEAAGVSKVSGDTRRPRCSWDRRAADLRIGHATQHGTSFPGCISVTIDLPTQRMSDWDADHSEALPDWLSEWTAWPSQTDNVAKLQRSGAAERHLFVLFPGFTTAPFSVAHLLVRSGAPLPQAAPVLPTGVTHVWAMSYWTNGDGFFWSPDDGWRRFDKVRETTTV